MAVALVGAVVARDITLAWDPSPDADVSGYLVSMGTNNGGPYPQQWPIAGWQNTQLVVSSLGADRYHFVAQAVNVSNLWSDASNQVETNIPEAPRLSIVEHPSVLLTGVVYRATSLLGPWEEFVRLPPVAVPLEDDLGLLRLGLEWSPLQL